MKHRMSLITAALFAASILACCCTQKEEQADPSKAIITLLDLHDLAGKQPDQRSPDSRRKEVDRSKLEPLIADLDAHDPFIADVYLGFVLGVLAHNQSRLYVERAGSEATVFAGKATVSMRLVDGRWKVVLGDSVPPEIKERAALEKKSFEEAKARARSMD